MPKKQTYEEHIEIFNQFSKAENNMYQLINIDMKNKTIIYKHLSCNTILEKSFSTFSTRKGCNNKNCINLKKQETCMNNYGVLNPSQSNEVKEKKKNTTLKNFSVDNPAKSKEIQEKIKLTNQKNLGVDYPMQSKEVQNKSKLTCKEKYGVESINQVKKIKQKKIKTCKKNLGVEYPTQSDEVQKKSYITKKIKNSFNSSKKEKILFKILQSKYIVYTQYVDIERYPFRCDFYLPEQDLFIEYQEHWTHGGNAFNNINKDHIEKLNKWKKCSQEINFKEKTKEYYKSAITTWTVRDVEKRKIAKNNNLNYLEIFSFKDEEDVLQQIRRVI